MNKLPLSCSKIKTRLLFCITALAAPLFSLTLDEAVHTALEKNPDINIMRSNVLLSKQLLQEKQSLRYGKLDATGSYTHYNIPRTLKPLVPPITSNILNTKDLFSVGITYNVALFTGFKEQRDVEMSALQEVMANSSLRISAQQLVYNIKSLYLKILSSQALLQAQRSHLSATEKLYNAIALEVELGKKAKIDALKSAATIENSKLKIIQIKSNIKVLKATLAMLMCVDSIDNLEQIATTQVVVDMDVGQYEEEIETLDRYQSVALNEKRTQKVYEKVNALYYPQVMFNSYYGQNISSDSNEELWQAGVNVNWTLFDFGKRSAQVQSAEIAQMQAKLQSAKVKLQMKKEFIEAVTNLEAAQQNIKSAHSEVVLIDETQKIEQVRYDNGAAELNDLLLAKAKLLLAQSRLIETKFQYQDALFYLEYLRESETF